MNTKPQCCKQYAFVLFSSVMAFLATPILAEIINHVVIGQDAPGLNYPYEQESIGVSNQYDNLRMQSPNGVFLHTGMDFAERVRITSDGKVGIGTTNPIGMLTIVGSDGDLRSVTVDSREIKFRGDGWAHMSIWGPTTGKRYLSIGDTSDNYVPGTPGRETLIITNDGRVGIGTTTPDATFSTVSACHTPVPNSDSRWYNPVNYAAYIHNASNSSSRYGLLISNYWRSDESCVLTVDGRFYNDGTLDGDDHDPYLIVRGNGAVGVGTAIPTHKLTVNGAIRAKEVIVDTGWADHVFNDDYPLQSLDVVERHIKEKKHLPGIPSAQEVAARGVSLGDMQALLLEKIEELTLHQIRMNKMLEEQSRIIDMQGKVIEAQSAQIGKLQIDREAGR